MTWFTENPTPVVVLGIVVEALFVVLLMKTGRREALWGVVLTALVTATAVVASFLIVTPREEVIAAIEEIRQLIEANNPPELVKRIDPSAVELRNRAQYDLANLTVDRAKVDGLKVLVISENSATVAFEGVVVFREGMNRPILLRFTVDLRKVDGVWLVKAAEYVPYRPGVDNNDAAPSPVADVFSDHVG